MAWLRLAYPEVFEECLSIFLDTPVVPPSSTTTEPTTDEDDTVCEYSE